MTTDDISCRTEKDHIDIYYHNMTKGIELAIEVKQYAEEHYYAETEESQLTIYSKHWGEML